MIYLYFVSMQAMHLFIIIIILLIVMFMLWTSFLNLHYGAFLVQQHPELTATEEALPLKQGTSQTYTLLRARDLG